MSAFEERTERLPRYDEWPSVPQCCATCYSWSGGLCCRHSPSNGSDELYTPRNGWCADWRDEP